MYALPLPFVSALFLATLAAVLVARRENGTQPAIAFLLLCVATSIVVGLRWTFDAVLLRFLLPVLLSTLPVAAWYCFAQAHRSVKKRWRHAAGPLLILLCSLTYPLWHPPVGLLLTLLDIGYGAALLRSSLSTRDIPEQVRLSDIEWMRKAEHIAGLMLLLAASIDGGLALDFAYFAGRHAVSIITTGHAVLLPVLAFTVVAMSLTVRPVESEPENPAPPETPLRNTLDDGEAEQIVMQLDGLIRSKELFLDPDLTLDRLARRSGIPSRRISAAINQVHGRNLSQVVNEYRIERARHLLATTDESITQVYLGAGFQTKSNFNREFSRITGQTPSGYRTSVRG